MLNVRLCWDAKEMHTDPELKSHLSEEAARGLVLGVGHCGGTRSLLRLQLAGRPGLHCDGNLKHTTHKH